MLKSNTKQMRNAYRAYLNADRWTYGNIYDAYERPSFYKVRAWDRCKALAYELEGSTPLILGHNSMAFSVGFIGWVEGVKSFVYITKDYDRYMPLERIDPETGEITDIVIWK